METTGAANPMSEGFKPIKMFSGVPNEYQVIIFLPDSSVKKANNLYVANNYVSEFRNYFSPYNKEEVTAKIQIKYLPGQKNLGDYTLRISKSTDLINEYHKTEHPSMPLTGTTYGVLFENTMGERMFKFYNSFSELPTILRVNNKIETQSIRLPDEKNRNFCLSAPVEREDKKVVIQFENTEGQSGWREYNSMEQAKNLIEYSSQYNHLYKDVLDIHRNNSLRNMLVNEVCVEGGLNYKRAEGIEAVKEEVMMLMGTDSKLLREMRKSGMEELAISIIERAVEGHNADVAQKEKKWNISNEQESNRSYSMSR